MLSGLAMAPSLASGSADEPRPLRCLGPLHPVGFTHPTSAGSRTYLSCDRDAHFPFNNLQTNFSFEKETMVNLTTPSLTGWGGAGQLRPASYVALRLQGDAVARGGVPHPSPTLWPSVRPWFDRGC